MLVVCILFFLFCFARGYLDTCCIDSKSHYDISSFGSKTFYAVPVLDDEDTLMTINVCGKEITPSTCKPSEKKGKPPVIQNYMSGSYSECWYVGSINKCSLYKVDSKTVYLEVKGEEVNNNVRTIRYHLNCNKSAEDPVITVYSYHIDHDTPEEGITTTMFHAKIDSNEVCGILPKSGNSTVVKVLLVVFLMLFLLSLALIITAMIFLSVYLCSSKGLFKKNEKKHVYTEINQDEE